MEIIYKINTKLKNNELNELFKNSWNNWNEDKDFTQILIRSLGYICAYHGEKFIGYVNIAWDGDQHAFLLDTTVHKDYHRRGIGTELVHKAIGYTRTKDIEWLHVDFEPHLESFYTKCGFRETKAGLINLKAF